MINAKFKRNANNEIYEFEMTGHADSGPYGQDIVCAAVSALAISTVNGLKEVVGLDPQVTSDDDEGGLLVVADIKTNRESDILLQTFANGMKDIAQNYADFITVQDS